MGEAHMKATVLGIVCIALFVAASPRVLPAAPPASVTPLTEVIHNATLQGKGTATSPLGVVPPAVPPLTGVTHDGTLAGNGTAASPLRVVPSGGSDLVVADANGVTIGSLLQRGLVARKINGTWVSIENLDATGVYADGADSFGFVYTSSDCSGTRYMAASDLPRRGLTVGSV